MTNISDTLAALSEAATQEDRDAAASYGRSVGILTRGEAAAMINGHNDDCTVVQAFAAHRRNVITEALRTGQLVPVPSVERVARMICESGGDDPDREGPWAGWWQESAYASMATAVIAAMQEGRDG